MTVDDAFGSGDLPGPGTRIGHRMLGGTDVRHAGIDGDVVQSAIDETVHGYETASVRSFPAPTAREHP